MNDVAVAGIGLDGVVVRSNFSHGSDQASSLAHAAAATSTLALTLALASSLPAT